VTDEPAQKVNTDYDAVGESRFAILTLVLARVVSVFA
jgi:hypothetical protein